MLSIGQWDQIYLDYSFVADVRLSQFSYWLL